SPPEAADHQQNLRSRSLRSRSSRFAQVLAPREQKPRVEAAGPVSSVAAGAVVRVGIAVPAGTAEPERIVGPVRTVAQVGQSHTGLELVRELAPSARAAEPALPLAAEWPA